LFCFLFRDPPKADFASLNFGFLFWHFAGGDVGWKPTLLSFDRKPFVECWDYE